MRVTTLVMLLSPPLTGREAPKGWAGHTRGPVTTMEVAIS
jgi:hypothetical protein